MPEEVPLSYAMAVGERLRALRKAKGLSLLGVEESSAREFKASVLGAYERGERVISVLRLQRLAQYYRVPVDQLLPPSPMALDGRGNEEAAMDGFSPKRPLTIDLVELDQTDAAEAQAIRRYIDSIQRQRSSAHGRSMAIRVEDLRALGRFFDKDETSMEVRLAELRLRC